ncbi:MAG: tetratricopeptide repeat protein [Bacteroidaceae bacterium]|nr:tetratricopeptide repeat protein [Bacteroidaceae bacterium]
MRRVFLSLLVISLSALSVFADKMPKGVEKARQSVASVVTYRQGVMLHNGTAVFAGDRGDLLSSRSLFVDADSAVVIDYKGVVRPVKRIVGINEVFDCIRLRVAADKKIKTLPVSETPVADGETLYLLGYGVGKGGFIEKADVERVDSIYSCAYYTLSRPMEQRFVALPLVNGRGELVALMQQAATSDTINSYAIGAAVNSMLDVAVPLYGKGYYPTMGIRTALPQSKADALSCLYMQTIVGDSVSYKSVIDDFVAAFPDSYEGYVSRAEYEAVMMRDFNAAEQSWNKAFKYAKNPAEVHFGKAKAINMIVLQGDTVSHPMLSLTNVLCEVDKAITADSLSLYINGKAEILSSHGHFAAAAECYKSLASTDMRGPDIFAKASQCYRAVEDYEKSVAMLDSAICCFDSVMVASYAPYILTRALVNASAKKYRDAVFDYNRYENCMSGRLGAEFYYFREQSELGAKMYRQALNDIDTAIYLDPQNVAYYIEKGLLCYRVKLSDEGIRTLQEAEAFAAGISDVHYLLGRLHVQKGDNEKAVSYLKRASELGHPDADAVLEQLKN